MTQALLEAEQAFLEEEVPVGAVAVLGGEIIAKGHNRVEALQDASAHAELLCLQAAAAKIQNWRLTEVTLYSTLEPCALCVGAIFSFRVKRVVWGAPDIRLGADGSFVSLLSENHPMHTVEVTRGVLADRSAQMMRDFFLMRRRKKK